MYGFGGDAEVLWDVLRSYAANTRPLLYDLRNRLERGDMPGYAIVAHGIKGSSYGIMARELGKIAEGLENAAKNGDIGAVKDGHSQLEKTANVLLDKLDRALPAENSGKPGASRPDPALLAELRDACRAFDMDRVDAAMEELESFKYESGGDLIRWLRSRVNSMEFEAVAEMEI